jgi:uncharacterized membrane protein (DUF485 family)
MPYDAPYDPFSPQSPAPTGQSWQTTPAPDPAVPPPHDGSDDGELHQLRSGYRRLRRVATFTALGYFVLFLLLSAYAPGLMTERIDGGLTIGLSLGLLTLPVGLVAIGLYERIARRRVDPLAERVRQRADEPLPTLDRIPTQRRGAGHRGWEHGRDQAPEQDAALDWDWDRYLNRRQESSPEPLQGPLQGARPSPYEGHRPQGRHQGRHAPAYGWNRPTEGPRR